MVDDNDQSKSSGTAEISRRDMGTESSEFNFSREITDYARELGGLAVDFDYNIQEGDAVNIKVPFFDISIEAGIVSAKIEPAEDLLAIIRILENYGRLGAIEDDFLDNNFDYKVDEPDRHTNGYTVEFNVPVTAKFLGRHMDIANIDPGTTTLTSGKVEATLMHSAGGGYRLTGKLRCFLNAPSVMSSKAADDFKRQHANQAEVEHVAWSSGLLSSELLVALNETLDDLAEKEVADFHPGSGGVVRDLVHPSMYCYVQGQSAVQGVPGDPLCTVAHEPRTSEAGSRDFWGRDYEKSIHQWLPSEFLVAQDGSTQIASYINNLDRDKYPRAYSLLEQLFERVLPLFEAVCGSLRNDFYEEGYGGTDKRSAAPISMPLRNRSLQVITKIVEYRVSDEANFDGVWHVEGMSHEDILATGLCIIRRDENFAGADIEFRRFLFESEADDLISYTPQNASSPIDRLGGGFVRPLGKLKTPAGQVIVFPNSHIHRLSSMYSTGDADAVRRIVVFWLVNPERPILSTANVAPQQTVMPYAVALRNRLALMAERKFHKEDYSQREVSNCEH